MKSISYIENSPP